MKHKIALLTFLCGRSQNSQLKEEEGEGVCFILGTETKPEGSKKSFCLLWISWRAAAVSTQIWMMQFPHCRSSNPQMLLRCQTKLLNSHLVFFTVTVGAFVPRWLYLRSTLHADLQPYSPLTLSPDMHMHALCTCKEGMIIYWRATALEWSYRVISCIIFSLNCQCLCFRILESFLFIGRICLYRKLYAERMRWSAPGI